MPARLPLAPLLALAAAAVPDAHAQTGETAAFVTRLGADTVAVERFVHRPDGVDATVVLRVPETAVTQSRLRFNPDGALQSYEAITTRPGSTAPVRTERARMDGDSLRVEVTTAEGTRTRAIAADARALPFVDMVHWPFETMLMRAPATGADTPQPLFTERGTVRFTVARRADGTATVTHPSRGAMAVTTDADGRLRTLDAAATTRKLVVTRVADVDVDGLARHFAARDAAGAGFGALSGRARPTFALGGATVAFDHGQPAARGRALFGALVPWGVRWRTGADLATHLDTDRDLLVGSGDAALRVPAGRYTLSSIPEADGGVLIVNRQTGQTGTAYDAARDLGRVPLRRVTGQPYAERLAIRVVPASGGAGELRIEWGDEAFVVPVRVAP